MRGLSYLIAAMLLLAGIIGFFVYGSAGLIQIPPPTLRFDFSRFAGVFRRAVQAIGLCCLMVILQNCAPQV